MSPHNKRVPSVQREPMVAQPHRGAHLSALLPRCHGRPCRFWPIRAMVRVPVERERAMQLSIRSDDADGHPAEHQEGKTCLPMRHARGLTSSARRVTGCSGGAPGRVGGCVWCAIPIPCRHWRCCQAQLSSRWCRPQDDRTRRSGPGIRCLVLSSSMAWEWGSVASLARHSGRRRLRQMRTPIRKDREWRCK